MVGVEVVTGSRCRQRQLCSLDFASQMLNLLLVFHRYALMGGFEIFQLLLCQRQIIVAFAQLLFVSGLFLVNLDQFEFELTLLVL